MAKLPEGYVEGVEKRNEAFLQALDGEDDLGMVIRAHIHVEHELREFIVAVAAQPAELKLSEYDYASTLKLALALGLKPSLKAGLTSLGTLRNKFAHRLEMKLTEQEASQMYATLSSEYKADARKSWTATVLKHPNLGRTKDMLKATPKDLIAMSIMMLHGGVMLEHLSLRHAAIVGP
jgi:hypothetical protein